MVHTVLALSSSAGGAATGENEHDGSKSNSSSSSWTFAWRQLAAGTTTFFQRAKQCWWSAFEHVTMYGWVHVEPDHMQDSGAIVQLTQVQVDIQLVAPDQLLVACCPWQLQLQRQGTCLTKSESEFWGLLYKVTTAVVFVTFQL